MLDARFSQLYFCQSLPTLQRGSSTIGDLLVGTSWNGIEYSTVYLLNGRM